jgi:Mn-dependent DtxR family transcriptional regulator
VATSRPELTEAEEKCFAAIQRLQKRYGDKKPPVTEVAEAMDYSHSRVSVLMQMLELKGYIKETFEVLV